MENQKISSKQVILNYGLILGILAIFSSLIPYVLNGLNMDPPLWQKLLGWAILIVVIILGIKKFKDFNNGILSLGEAMKIGLGIALIGALITAIYIFMFFNYVEPDFMGQLAVQMEEKMMEQNPDMSEDQIDMAINMTKKFMSPLAMVFFMIIGNLIMGLIISLIGGLIMKQDESHNY